MARGTKKDKREVFHIDRLRFIVRSDNPKAAPERNTCEVFIKNKSLYSICDKGIVSPITGVGLSASPGFTWGFKGNAVTGKWLNNDGVPSSATGRLLDFTDPTVRKIQTNVTSSSGTCRLQLLSHDGASANIEAIATIVLDGATEKVQSVNIPITAGKQMAVRVIQGSCVNPVVGVLLDGLL
jgi:hypothetical protein